MSVSSIRSSFAVVAATILAVGLGAVPSGASAKVITSPPLSKGSTYLALGDSVTFGYEEPQVVPAPNYGNASSFVAYPEIIGKELRLKIVNPACPGETSASFINTNAQSNGCENALGTKIGYRTLHPLHVKYKGSQLSYAVSYLRSHRNVRLVSLMIGANDIFLCQKTTPSHCLAPSEQKAAFAKIGSNERKILSAIRNQARYRGQLVLVNYFSLNYAVPLFNGVSRGLNATMNAAGKPYGALTADGFGQFRQGTRIFGGDTCKAGLITLLSTGKCGVHPTYQGQGLLAQAVLNAVNLAN